MKKTPLTILIEKLERIKNNYPTGSAQVIINQISNDAQELRPTEREGIEKAHEDANRKWAAGHPTPISTGDVYFTDTYEQ
jgi:hypothetical protein